MHFVARFGSPVYLSSGIRYDPVIWMGDSAFELMVNFPVVDFPSSRNKGLVEIKIQLLPDGKLESKLRLEYGRPLLVPTLRISLYLSMGRAVTDVILQYRQYKRIRIREITKEAIRRNTLEMDENEEGSCDPTERALKGRE